MISKTLRKPAIRVGGHGIVWLLVAFTTWLGVQSAWAMAPVEHSELLSYYAKFIVAVCLVYYCVDSESSLRILLWSFVGGCFYFGWIAFTTYLGGRFEGFGGAGIGEANAGALVLATGTLVSASLFLSGGFRSRVVLLVMIPFIVNGIVTTISRSGFLALGIGGLAFLAFRPAKYRRQIKILTLLALMLFGALAGPAYWQRMHSLQQAGDEVEGVDTGKDRIETIKAQWKMFKRYPLGCGAMCTAALSPYYLDEKYLAPAHSGEDPGRMVRASHNTFMSMLVEHGIPGAIFYLGMLMWIAKAALAASRVYRNGNGLSSAALPAIVGALVAISVGDMFVSYAKLEVRFWFLAMLMSLLAMDAQRQCGQATSLEPISKSQGAHCRE